MDELCPYTDCRVKLYSADLCKRNPATCEFYKFHLEVDAKLKRLEEHPLILLDIDGSLERSLE